MYIRKRIGAVKAKKFVAKIVACGEWPAAGRQYGRAVFHNWLFCLEIAKAPGFGKINRDTGMIILRGFYR
jgi:hypothetical protein